MTLVIGALTIGLILSVLALGIYISFRIFDFPDITAEGSITLGAAVAATLLVAGVNPLVATTAAFCAGMAAGALTGVLHTKFKINGLLSGILVMTALYSVNLHVMGKSNVPLLSSTTLGNYAEDVALALGMTASSVRLLGWEVSVRDVSILVGVLGAIVMTGIALDRFFRTHLGTAMRATGDNPQMIRALGVDVERHDDSGACRLQRPSRRVGGAARTVSRVCRRPNGHRNAGLGPCERHYRRGAGWRAIAWAFHCRSHYGLGVIPVARGDGAPMGSRSE